jgi:DNA mismatch endonuclease (patch repair protein)
MDSLSPAERSERMRRVRGKDSKVELHVRRLVHKLGYRFRKHAPDLPGHPDMVFRRRQKAIFVHGCFWHRHDCAMGNRLPKSRLDFWEPKLSANRRRDEQQLGELARLGWQVLVIWECETGDDAQLAGRVRAFLDA